MIRCGARTLILVGSIIATLPADGSARCSDVGTPQFRCDPLVAESLRRRSETQRHRPVSRPSRRTVFESQSYTTATGATRRTYRYTDSRGDERRGVVLELPGAVRMREARQPYARHLRPGGVLDW